jgi:cytochrome c-type biogenesis protein CcmH/NrfG
MRPRDAAVWAGLGAARLQGGNARAAMDAYRQAIQIEPRNPRYHVAMGRALVAAGDRARARQAFEHALSLDPDNREAREQLSRL